METRAWKNVPFDYPRAVPTMLAEEEKRYLFWLGRDAWDGNALVVEIGPWLGGSTVCLAAGMKASGKHAHGRLHTVDNFLWRDFMAARAPLPLQNGESFLPHFQENVEPYHDLIVAHARALPDDSFVRDAERDAKRFTEDESVPLFDGIPGDEPISILFIDGAKSWRGMRHLLRVLSPRLQPGKSLLVCQDFKHWSTYWVPMMMARLAGLVEPVHNVIGGTTVAFRLLHSIPTTTLDTLEDSIVNVPVLDGLDLIGHAAEWLADDGDALGAANVTLASVRFLSNLGKNNEAASAFEEIQSAWPSHRDVTQLVMASAFVRSQTGRDIRRPLPISLTWQWQKLVGAWRKHVSRRT